MADDLKTRETRVQPEVRRERPLARTQAVPWLIVILLLAATAWLGWRAFFYQEEGDPVGSAMLAFERQLHEVQHAHDTRRCTRHEPRPSLGEQAQQEELIEGTDRETFSEEKKTCNHTSRKYALGETKMDFMKEFFYC